MNGLQARLLVIGLEMEIKSNGEMKMTREPAMKSLGRLLKIDAYATFGKGIKGRQKALDWLNEMIALEEANEMEYEQE
jgi:hypothetical protein